MTRTCNNTFPSKGFKGDGKAGFWSPKGVAGSPEGDSLYAYPARESLWSPNGVAKIMQGAKPVRLAAEAFLLFVQKEPKYAWGCAPRPPNAQAAAGYERCKHRPYGAADTLSRCLRRILFWILQGPNENKHLISVVASDATFA